MQSTLIALFMKPYITFCRMFGHIPVQTAALGPSFLKPAHQPIPTLNDECFTDK